MTAKRFTGEFDKQYSGVYDDGEQLTNFKVVGLLNDFHDEKQSVIDWIDRKIEEIKPYNSELCRATLIELKEFLE